MPNESDPRIIEDGYYSPHAVFGKLGIDTATQENERRAGRLKFIERAGQPIYLGRDLLAWLSDPKIDDKAGRSKPVKLNAGCISHPTKGQISAIKPDQTYFGRELTMQLGLDIEDQRVARESRRLRCAEVGDGYDTAKYVGTDVIAWLNSLFSSTQGAIAATPGPSPRPMTSASTLRQGTLQVQQAKKTFELLIEAEMKKGFSRIKATSRVVAAHPDLHEALLREANGGRDRVHCLPGR
ncbi:MAG TPA: hypothetical protein VMV69_16155 [Pirellulales bacterium]|nr:hypothetical protein [Pirellulales bacterium]